MIDSLPPGALLIVGALLFPALRGRLQQVWLVLLPVASFLHLLSLGEVTSSTSPPSSRASTPCTSRTAGSTQRR